MFGGELHLFADSGNVYRVSDGTLVASFTKTPLQEFAERVWTEKQENDG